MEDFFGSDGILKQRLPHFDYRPQQQALAEKIEQFLRTGLHLLAAEAPTGIGKTYAMLIPAMEWATSNNSTVLVLTSGITLQEQLIGKDVLFIANFPPRKMMGIESQGMILSAVNFDGTLSVTTTLGEVKPGSQVG